LKLHRPLAATVIQALHQIFGEGHYPDKVIERVFKANRKLGSRDRRFVAETVYETVRWWRLLWAALETEPTTEERGLWRLLGAQLVLAGERLPSWDEFRGLDEARIRRAYERAQEVPAIRESVPDWLYDRGLSELGERWDGILHALNEQAPVVLRANRLKTTREELRKVLERDGTLSIPAPATEDGLILRERKNVFTTEAFKQGLFELQDGASQQVAPMLAIEPGHRVIDACAGAGGKTLHIAALLKNKGKVIAMDVHPRKLEELRKRSTRAGCDVIETKLIDSNKVIKRLETSADRVLLDVPCSGLGVLRRNPDSKWKLSAEEIDRLRALQAEILKEYSVMVKKGGRLVYATCSCLPSENEKQVEAFLAAHPGEWRLVEERKFTPGENGYDGFYAAALERT
jgi:16S rRNA (cytosine967-C5)-methyltransferase